MRKIVLLSLLAISVFADYRVVQEIKVNNGKVTTDYVYDYTIQTVCKYGYQYTVVIKGTNIGITQDFKSSSTSTLPRVIECENEK